MASMNQITVVGYLGDDPKLGTTQTGKSVCNFSVATCHKNGDKEETTWFRIQVWEKQGEACSKSLRKGSQVQVIGRLSERKWQDTSGVERTSLDIVARDVLFLGASAIKDDNAMQKQHQQGNAAPQSYDDIPF